MTTTTNLWTDYMSQWSRVPSDLKRRYGTITTFCEHHCKIADDSPSGQITRIIHSAEHHWMLERKPYYRVYPSLVTPFVRLDLAKVTCSSLQMPTGLSSLLIQLPSHPSLKVQTQALQNVLITFDERQQDATKWLNVFIQSTRNDSEGPYNSIFRFEKSDATILEMVRSITERVSIGSAQGQPALEVLEAGLKVMAVCLLLEDDPQLIVPEVLTDDQRRWEETLDPKYVQKAHNRGKIGWTIGREYEVIPHWRRPHLARVWTGKGRSIPKVVMRAGAIVHRKQVESIPTGFGAA